MARRRQTLVNPASGERITFHATAAETDGELVAIDLELPEGGRVPGGLHIHPHQEERFEVVSGTMRFRVRRERIIAEPGDVVVVPAGVPHDFANAGDETALVRVEIRPALRMEQLFETAVALAEQGRTMFGAYPGRSISPSSRASSNRKYKPPSHHAGCSGSRSHHWPGSPGGAAAISGTRGRERVARSRPQLLRTATHHERAPAASS